MKLHDSKVSRTTFLQWGLGSVGAFAVGCASDAGAPVGGAGTGGAAGGMGGGVGGGMGGTGGMSGGGGIGPAGQGGMGGSTAGQGGAGGNPPMAGQGGAAGQNPGGAAGTDTGGSGMGGDGAGGEGPDPACQPPADQVGTDCNLQINVVVTANHGHTLEIPLADILAGEPKSYNGQGPDLAGGVPNHPHWMQFTAEDFATLQAGGTVIKVTCNDGHEHQYIVSCGTLDPTSQGLPSRCGVYEECSEVDNPDLRCGYEDGSFCRDI